MRCQHHFFAGQNIILDSHLDVLAPINNFNEFTLPFPPDIDIDIYLKVFSFKTIFFSSNIIYC